MAVTPRERRAAMARDLRAQGLPWREVVTALGHVVGDCAEVTPPSPDEVAEMVDNAVRVAVYRVGRIAVERAALAALDAPEVTP